MLLLGAVSAFLYHYQTHPEGLHFRWQEGLMVVSCLFAAVCVLHFWRQLKCGSLAWDGLFWQSAVSSLDEAQGQSSPITGIISVRFDGQRCLLIKFVPVLGGAHAQWLWLEQAFAPELWQDVRRAVYSRANEAVFNTQN